MIFRKSIKVVIDKMGNKVAKSDSSSVASRKSIFDFSVESSGGEEVKLESYKGKKAYVVLNAASQ